MKTETTLLDNATQAQLIQAADKMADFAQQFDALYSHEMYPKYRDEMLRLHKKPLYWVDVEAIISSCKDLATELRDYKKNLVRALELIDELASSKRWN